MFGISQFRAVINPLESTLLAIGTVVGMQVVKQVIRNLGLKRYREIARAALGLPSTAAVMEYLSQFIV